mmetsp:Transcript_550/g.893  ORF Transcript_550/g.893 Transcript_550/m.893 type:complete len:201 (-) Transcript_550:290-892(-)
MPPVGEYDLSRSENSSSPLDVKKSVLGGGGVATDDREVSGVGGKTSSLACSFAQDGMVLPPPSSIGLVGVTVAALGSLSSKSSEVRKTPDKSIGPDFFFFLSPTLPCCSISSSSIIVAFNSTNESLMVSTVVFAINLSNKRIERSFVIPPSSNSFINNSLLEISTASSLSNPFFKTLVNCSFSFLRVSSESSSYKKKGSS